MDKFYNHARSNARKDARKSAHWLQCKSVWHRNHVSQTKDLKMFTDLIYSSIGVGILTAFAKLASSVFVSAELIKAVIQ